MPALLRAFDIDESCHAKVESQPPVSLAHFDFFDEL